MLQKNYAFNDEQYPASRSTLYNSSNVPRQESAHAIHLRTAVAIYVTIEFFRRYLFGVLWQCSLPLSLFRSKLLVDNACVLACRAYDRDAGLNIVHATSKLFLLSKAISAHIFVGGRRGSSARIYRILTILFFTQSAEAYSRGSLIFQIVSVGLTVTCARTMFFSWLQGAIAAHRIEARRVVLIGDDFHCSKFRIV